MGNQIKQIDDPKDQVAPKGQDHRANTLRDHENSRRCYLATIAIY